MRMANAVTNILTIHGNEDQIAKVRETIKGKNGEPISFESFIPMPEEYNSNEMVEVTVKGYPKPLSLPLWYLWRCAYWGSKWDAQFIDEEVPDGLMFNTPDETPYAAMKTLSKMFPKVTFHVTFSDQCSGFCCGEYTLRNRKAKNTVFLPLDYSDKSMEYYFLTHEYERDEWKKNEAGKWGKIEEEEKEETEVESDMEYTYVE